MCRYADKTNLDGFFIFFFPMWGVCEGEEQRKEKEEWERGGGWDVEGVLKKLTGILEAKRKKGNDEKDPERKFCVLVNTGVYSPFHLGHSQMLKIAAHYLSHYHAYTVLGAFISPCNDTYAKKKAEKNGTQFVEAHHRLKMAELGVDGEDWIHVSPFEASYPSFSPPFSSLLSSLTSALSSSLPPSLSPFPFLDVLLVVGEDHGEWCVGGFEEEQEGKIVVGKGVVIIPRGGSEGGERRIENRSKKVFFAGEGGGEYVPMSLSSTAIRELLREKRGGEEGGERLNLSPLVHSYILENNLYL